jgi:hypothetical protein
METIINIILIILRVLSFISWLFFINFILWILVDFVHISGLRGVWEFVRKIMYPIIKEVEELLPYNFKPYASLILFITVNWIAIPVLNDLLRNIVLSTY